MNKYAFILVSTATLSSLPFNSSAEDLRAALTEADVDLGLRYRIEHVEVDDVEKDSVASTLKTRLTFQSKPFHNTQLLLEFDDVHVIGEQNYGDADQPTIADPEGTDLNQAALKYSGLKDTTFILGKQRIVLGNQRFIGGVAWRQHEQTYNGFTVSNTSIANTKLTYSFIDQVNHFVETKPDANTDSHILYLENSAIDNHKLTGYAFLYDYTDVSNGANSTQTIGARVEGNFENLGYALEYAQQSEYSRPSDAESFSATYQHIEVSYKLSDIKLLAGLEVLGSDDGEVAFSTPTATKHKFNGWADQFLNTPTDGLEDSYLGASATFSGINIKAIYHDYEAQESDADYGSEINIAVSKKFGQVKSLVKYADYSADEDDSRKDTQKLWLQLATTF